MRIGFKFDNVGMPQKAADDLLSGLVGTISWVRLFNDSLRLSGEIKPTERVDAFSISDNGIAFSVVAMSGVTWVSKREKWRVEAQDLAVCRGSWLLGTACGHCSRCQEEAPRAIAGLRATVEALNKRVTLIVSCIPPKSLPNVDLIDACKVGLFDACRTQLYDENGRLR